jgi:Mg/Co/Ni transporter MgtE
MVMSIPTVGTDPLLQRFADSRPTELAALMANADVGELSELLARLPAQTGARLAARLPSRILSQLLAAQPPGATSEMLTKAKHDDAVALVAHLHEARYPEILAASKRSELGKLNRLFEFPQLSLSALASPEFIRVNENTGCEEFCTELEAYGENATRPVFTVDEEGVYRGVLDTFRLLAARNRKIKVREISDYVTPLSGDTTAATALDAPEWLEHLALPVTDHRQRIIGCVTRSRLRRLVPDTRAERYGFEMMLSEMATAYLVYCADILRSLFARGHK